MVAVVSTNVVRFCEVSEVRFVGIREFRDQAAVLLKAVREKEEAFVLTYHGKPFGIVLPLREEDLEDFVLARHPAYQVEWEAAREEIHRGEYTTLEQLCARLEEKV
jgi:antitoxin (DNA-binding transcriptional repressor) of toxin-antitoxin stability system